MVNALARLGFIFEPTEGWHAGRAPAPSDLSMALAYAGLDARNMRHLPSADYLPALPGSIGADVRGCLAAHAPGAHGRQRGMRLGGLAPSSTLVERVGPGRTTMLSDRHQPGVRARLSVSAAAR